MYTGLYFPVFGLNLGNVFSPNTGKYGPEITPYLNTFHPVRVMLTSYCLNIKALLLSERRTSCLIYKIQVDAMYPLNIWKQNHHVISTASPICTGIVKALEKVAWMIEGPIVSIFVENVSGCFCI